MSAMEYIEINLADNISYDEIAQVPVALLINSTNVSF